jgi:hypothetical protein
MTKSPDNNSTSNKKLLVQYASIGAQILAGLIVSIFAGKWIDGKLPFGFRYLYGCCRLFYYRDFHKSYKRHIK